MAVATGVEGMVYIVVITGAANHARNVVYGRDFFEHDRLYTKVRKLFDSEAKDFSDFQTCLGKVVVGEGSE